MPGLSKVLLAGSGKNLYFLALNFISKGYRVTIVDPDREECTQLARELKATVVHGDASYPQVLEDSGAFEMDAVIALTQQDQDNLVICQSASLHYQVPRCMALVNDPENEEVFKRLGVTAFSVAGILGSLIDRQVSWEEITSLLPLGGGRVNVLEMVLEKAFPVCDKPIQQVALPRNSLIAVVMNKEGTQVPHGGTVLQDGDRIILITLPDTLGESIEIITGKKSR